MTRDPFRAAVRDYVTAAAQADATIDPTALADAFAADNPELIEQAAVKLAHEAIRRMITRLGRERPEDTGQLALLPGLPRLVCTAPDRWVPLEKATFADLLEGRREREEHIRSAEKALDLYDRDLDRLRPIMEATPEMTVAEALERMEDA